MGPLPPSLVTRLTISMLPAGAGAACWRAGGVAGWQEWDHVNVLFVTLDQLRADCLSAVGHPLVETPHLDRLAATGVRFANHHSQAAPCGPARAALYTGTYQMNNRVVANGTPLEDRFDNVARLARRAGFAPALFGYTDQGVDPAHRGRCRRPEPRHLRGHPARLRRSSWTSTTT